MSRRTTQMLKAALSALHYTGAEESQAVKIEHCVVNHVISELEVSCLPGDLPEFITVDLSGLTSKSVLALQSVKLPNGVKAVVRGSNKNPSLVSIKLPEVVVEAAAAAPPDSEQHLRLMQQRPGDGQLLAHAL